MDDRFIKSLSIDWPRVDAGSYLRGIPSLQRLEQLRFTSNVTLFAGENGTGKSTLLEAVAVAFGFNPEGGTLSYHFSTFDDVSPLSAAVRLVKGCRRPQGGFFFRAESFFNLASKAEDYRDGLAKEVFYRRYGGRPLHEQSHGESFLGYLQSAASGGLYIMDEPEAALSPQRQLALLLHVHRMARQGAQFIIATHSPILLSIPGAQLLSFGPGGPVPCAWEDTESYRVTEMFVNGREAFLSRLLADE